MRMIARVGLVALMLGLATCATRQRATQLEETLQNYAALIRWNEFAAAADYYDPKLRESKPITRLEMDRLNQFRVSQYRERAESMSSDGLHATQSVEIHLYNVHTMAERVIVDHQSWRYDPDGERWWLTSGLPDVTASR